MRKINQEIAPLVPGSRRRTHFTGQGGSEGPSASPSRALGCIGPSQGWSILWVGGGRESGEGRVSGGSAGTSLRGRFHTLSRPRVPTRLDSLTLPLPGLPVRPLLSLHLGPVSALLSQPFRLRSSTPPPQAEALGLRHCCSPAEREPGAGGVAGAQQHQRRPQLRWPWTALKPGNPLSCPLQPFQPVSNLPAAPDSHPSTHPSC